MTLLRALEETEANTLQRLSVVGGLLIDGEGQRNCYYGVPRGGEHKEDILAIEAILSKSVGGFISFCSFTKDNRIRFIYDWSYGEKAMPFSGVGYLYIQEVTKGKFLDK